MDHTRNDLKYACDLHNGVATVLRCSSLSLVRAFTYIRIYEEKKERTPSRLEITASLLLAIKVVEPRSYTQGVDESFVDITGASQSDLFQAECSISGVIDLQFCASDMVDHFQSFVLSRDARCTGLEIMLSKMLSVIVASLATGSSDPRENVIPQVYALVTESPNTAISWRRLVDRDAMHSANSTIKLPRIVLRLGYREYTSRCCYSDGRLHVKFMVATDLRNNT